jgi:16S rRNA (cytosine967-C5)-methyltransferase
MADARYTALTVLNTLDQGGKTLDRILLELPQGDHYLSRRDRALLSAIVYGVLRWRGRLDHIIAYFSHTPLHKIQPGVLNILRLGLFQIIFLDRVPDSAAVNTAVELTKQTASSRASGFVNALLRKATQDHRRVPFPTFQQDPLAFLSSRQSIPKWLARRWLQHLSTERINAVCKAINTIPPITLRTNTLKTNREQLLRSLEDQAEHLEPTAYAPDGINIFNLKRSMPQLATYKKGWFQVQDEAAQLVALLLDPQPGESVLDACAGLGGKTAHMAQLMQNQGAITALDNNPEKLQQLGTAMARLGVSIVQTTCSDLLSPLEQNARGVYDRILLDAPCSGLGVMRRNPDIKWNSSAARLERRAEVQKQILPNLAAAVKPGGILVYAVCSMEPEENDAVIEDFLKKQPDFVIDKHWGKLPETIRSGVKRVAGFTTMGFINQMDGFFLARLKRKK